MKYDWKYLSGCLFFLLFAACTEKETLAPQTSPGIAISVSSMELKDDHTQTRALYPLTPEKENLLRTVSLLVFDEEGQHYIEHTDYYRYIQVADHDNPEGKLQIYEPEYGGNLSGNGTLCAVANMNQKDLLDALREKAAEEGGRNVLSLDAFKNLSINLPYINHKDSVGLVNDIYMFGYYAGDLKPSSDGKKDVTISLGRLIARLDVSLSVDAQVEQEQLHFAIRLGNTSRHAYLFPGDRTPGKVITDPYFVPVELKQAPSSFYYYVGPHAAVNEDQATYIEIGYGKILTEDGTLDMTDNSNKCVKIALCNDPPGVENRNYQLNRNSIYQIAIRLVKKKGENKSAAGTRAVMGAETSLVELDI